MRWRSSSDSFWLADLSIRQPVLIAMLALAVIVVGIVSYARMPVDLYPDVSLPVVVVQTIYPGASPADVEQTVSKPIEDALESLNGAETIHSTSTSGASLVTVELAMGQDPKAAADDVRSHLDLMRNALPVGAREPIVETFDPSAAPILSVAFADPDGQRSPAQLRSLLDDEIKPALEQVPGVAAVDDNGGQVSQIHVDVLASRLRDYRLAPERIVQAIQGATTIVPVGRIPNGARDALLTTPGSVASPSDLADVVVATLPDGSTVHLRDVASVAEGPADDQQIRRLDGSISVVASVHKQSGSNSIAVADAVKGKLDDLQRKYPDLKVAIASDQSTYTREAVDDLQRSLLVGAALAALVVLIFFRDLRNTLVTVAGLPVVILGAVAVLGRLGVTLNLISMMAMSLSVGMLIDDAIVVRENIYRRVERGEEPRLAASAGTAEIAMAVVAVTATIVAVFLPIAFTEGIAGKFLRDFGLTVAVAVLISLVEAFTLAPMLSAVFFHQVGARADADSVNPSGREMFSSRSRLTDAYRRLLGWALSHRAIVVLVAILSLVVSGALFSHLQFSFIPPSDLGEFSVTLDSGPGAPLSQTDRAAHTVETLLRGDPSVEHVFTTVGSSDGSTSRATIDVRLLERGQTTATIQRLRPPIQAALPGVAFTVDALSTGASVGSDAAATSVRGRPIQYSIQSSDPAALDRVSAELVNRLRAVPGLVDVASSVQPGAPELAVVLDQSKAAAEGLSPAQVGTALRALVTGETAGSLSIGGDQRDVVVRLAATDRQSPAALLQVPLVTARGSTVSLADVGHLEQTTEPSEIDRENRQAQVVVGASFERRSQGAALADAQQIVGRLQLPAGVTINASGQAKYTGEMASALGLVMGLGVLFVYMILASQFASFTQPFVIMLALPFSFVGALLALFLARFDFDMLAMIGLILLMGLVTKNSILLVDLANRLRRNGLAAREAMLQAGPVRLRPILMTTTAMIGGMVPVALGVGAGSETRRPMGIAIVGGLVTSTLLTLVAVPVAYTLLTDGGRLLGQVRAHLPGGGSNGGSSGLARSIAAWVIAFGVLGALILQATNGPTRDVVANVLPTPTVAATLTPVGFTPVPVNASPPPTAAPSPIVASSPTTAPHPSSPPVRRVRVANTDGLGLNLRPAPGLTVGPTAILPEGSSVQPLGQTTTADGHVWLKVRAQGGAIGWVAEDYVAGGAR